MRRSTNCRSVFAAACLPQRVCRTYQGGRGHGFTLIELLVVIAIIAILAAILFPVFAQAREKARQATCTSNQKNIALALQQYAQDYDEIFVYSPTWCNIPGRNQNQPWRPYYLLVDPYLRNLQVFTCPSAPQIQNCINGSIVHHGVNDAINWGWVPRTFRLSYGISENIQNGERPNLPSNRSMQTAVVGGAMDGDETTAGQAKAACPVAFNPCRRRLM
ncbi:MAG: hypothetical protein SLRJCFUN_000653 [Candidatus Fervidibacter sp.]